MSALHNTTDRRAFDNALSELRALTIGIPPDSFTAIRKAFDLSPFDFAGVVVTAAALDDVRITIAPSHRLTAVIAALREGRNDPASVINALGGAGR